MAHYAVENTRTGHLFGYFEAESEAHALEVFANDSGYDSFASLARLAPSRAHIRARLAPKTVRNGLRY